VLQAASERVFVPLTVGGGIRGFSAAGKDYPALTVASEYFRCGCSWV
jgi:glutamine amidotransferase/cyclase